MVRIVILGIGLVFWVHTAHADIDEKCQGMPRPDDYNEQVQQDFLQNYYALSSSNGVLHAPMPHDGGHGALLVDAAVIPPLPCARRYVINWSKTEHTNHSPILPRLVASYAFPTIADRLTFYASFGILPPIRFSGVRTLVLSGEFGAGVHVVEHFDVGVRAHATMQRTRGDIAMALDTATQPAIEDLYLASTWGVDVLLGAPVDVRDHTITPFVSAGYLKADTSFFVGDDSFMAKNPHPYAGLALGAGLDMLFVDHVRLGMAFFGAPGGYAGHRDNIPDVAAGARYGHIYTARLRIGYEF